MGTEKLFKSMLGRVYTVHGFDRYGNVELHPKRFERVWVEAEFLKLRVRKKLNISGTADFSRRSG
jgi:hypothetical protein